MLKFIQFQFAVGSLCRRSRFHSLDKVLLGRYVVPALGHFILLSPR